MTPPRASRPPLCPAAARSLEEAGDLLLTLYAFPKALPQLLTRISLGNPAPLIGFVCGLIVLVMIPAYLVIGGP